MIKNKAETYIKRQRKCGLEDRLNEKIASYSRNDKEVIAIEAVMTHPKLAILDEPTSELDVINALEIRKIIRIWLVKGCPFY